MKTNVEVIQAFVRREDAQNTRMVSRNGMLTDLQGPLARFIDHETLLLRMGFYAGGYGYLYPSLDYQLSNLSVKQWKRAFQKKFITKDNGLKLNIIMPNKGDIIEWQWTNEIVAQNSVSRDRANRKVRKGMFFVLNPSVDPDETDLMVNAAHIQRQLNYSRRCRSPWSFNWRYGAHFELLTSQTPEHAYQFFSAVAMNSVARRMAARFNLKTDCLGMPELWEQARNRGLVLGIGGTKQVRAIKAELSLPARVPILELRALLARPEFAIKTDPNSWRSPQDVYVFEKDLMVRQMAATPLREKYAK